MAATAASERTLKSLSITIGALTAAIEMDVDRNDADRVFFAEERAALQSHFEKIFEADQAVTKHLYLVKAPRQAAIVLGDHVLDRGVRSGKARMRLELKNSTLPGGEDHVFPSDISEITDAERHVEPGLVLKAVGKFDLVPDFTGKATVAADLTGRATRQAEAFKKREESEIVEEKLDGVLEQAVADGEDALVIGEAHLSARFPRDAKYVASFFAEKPARKKKKTAEAPSEPTTP